MLSYVRVVCERISGIAGTVIGKTVEKMEGLLGANGASLVYAWLAGLNLMLQLDQGFIGGVETPCHDCRTNSQGISAASSAAFFG